MPWLHDPSPCHCLHNPKLPLSLLKDTGLGKTRAFWSIETSHLTPPPHPQVLTWWVYHIPRVCPRTSCPLSPPHPFFHSLPPHLFSLWLVCLLSQLLSKKRGLFRIHAGHKQRYPQLRACARGHAKTWPNITSIFLLNLTQTIRSAWKHSPFCGSVRRFFFSKNSAFCYKKHP